jgi:hypothetical protein
VHTSFLRLQKLTSIVPCSSTSFPAQVHHFFFQVRDSLFKYIIPCSSTSFPGRLHHSLFQIQHSLLKYSISYFKYIIPCSITSFPVQAHPAPYYLSVITPHSVLDSTNRSVAPTLPPTPLPTIPVSFMPASLYECAYFLPWFVSSSLSLFQPVHALPTPAGRRTQQSRGNSRSSPPSQTACQPITILEQLQKVRADVASQKGHRSASEEHKTCAFRFAPIHMCVGQDAFLPKYTLFAPIHMCIG